MKVISKLISFVLVCILFSCTTTPKEKTEIEKQSYTNQESTAHHSIALEVLQASKDWINAFNQGNVSTCIAGYKKDAVMRATPFGLKQGETEIEAFWKPFIESGASNLIYTNVAIEVINKTTALLSANWSMNIGRGVIYQEKWIKENNKWVLVYDDFEVKEQYETPKENPTNPIGSHLLLEDVINSSIKWIEGFNAGNGDICGEGYTKNATMNAIPFTNLHSKTDIQSFWNTLMNDGASNLIYNNPKFEVINTTVIKLSSDWSMNIGEGKIYQEKWVKENDTWLLDYDEFEVLKQYNH
ncbi:hypothetical protein [Aquimarina sp. 2201CG5-10]|uniref:hypothetical protein n=1 Tax=Aquimarina callyspongiae TaxID=3098150 RepID=UPI002AB38403|nr:hypothetical protein [Aquimarina sp. 2201CG5-10]MDY8135491.1 hypothetical protein [Aquimarina sp. 2201CG5-10]